jgi:hypothetical protein
LIRLNIDELYTLLVNADPHGSIPKQNKKILQAKANLMSNIKAALGHFFVSNSICPASSAAFSISSCSCVL